MRKDPYAKERAEARLRAKEKEIAPDVPGSVIAAFLRDLKGADGHTPVKGKDYYTELEKRELISEIKNLIPVPKDADPVDYDLVFSYVVQEVEDQVKKEVAKLPKPKDGIDGKDAKVDIPAIVKALLKAMPKMESKEVDYLGVKEYIDKEITKIKALPPKVVQSFTGGGATHISQLADVDLSGLSKNADGQYILGSGGGGASAFTDLTDTPADYTGEAGKAVIVNATEDGLEYAPLSGGGDMLASVYDPAGGAKQVAFENQLFSGDYDDLTNKPTLFDGSYNSLSDVPSTFTPSAHSHVASDITDFQTAVSANSDVTANTADRHSHSNKALLDTYTQTEADLADAVSKKHDAATVSDTTSIDMTIIGQQISAQREALTGDVTAAKNSNATTIANGAVSNAKLANMATQTIKGRNTAGTGDPEDLTAANVRSIINVADGATANSSDAHLLDRANHTGVQAISTVTDLQTTLDARVDYKVTTTTSSATPAVTGDAMRNELRLTAQAVNTTIGEPSGTAVAGNLLKMTITATGGTRTIGYNAIYDTTSAGFTELDSLDDGQTGILLFEYIGSDWVQIAEPVII